MKTKAIAFYCLICILGVAAIVHGAWTFESASLVKFIFYLCLAIAASRLRVSLPGIDGCISVNFIFILSGIIELSLGEALIVGSVGVLAQALSGDHRPQLRQAVFNVSTMAVTIWAAYFLYHGLLRTHAIPGLSLPLMLSACAYFVGNTLPVAAIICLTENKNLRQTWKDCFFWYFPYYLVGAAIAGLMSWMNRTIGWQPTVLALPAMWVIYRSYRLYLTKLQDEKRHVEEMASLHLRTIEALALAIEAKDQTTHDHLQRVRVYAVELGQRMGIVGEELEALRAAALLHDIGKLAVPEHIISKPGRLTREEFEKMKIHPTVGAEILERVQFPYPVVPIVRSHHEKWDGSGYPQGLKGEDIPIGARILSAVDCLDALASDRQYRSALPLDEAMKHVAADAGKAFDPRVVELLQKTYIELEQIAHSQSMGLVQQKLSTQLKVERGAAPDAGFETRKASLPSGNANFLASIAAARHEAQTLFELSQDLGNSLSLDETLSVLCVRLKRLVPYDSVAAYIVRDNELVPEFASGDNFRIFASLRIPMGQGLSGWVAHNRKSIVNGNPSVEPGYTNDNARFSVLQSAISVPLEGLQGVLGVLTLYSAERDTYTSDHLRILMAISSKVALSVENALAFRKAESSATTDFLTELPNARSLFLHLDREMARCKRLNTSVTVMVCDLDGFKQINDRFGHLEGNRVLKIFARSLQGSCREYDYVARMGGDEFVVVAPGLALPAATSRAVCLSELATAAGREVCGEDIIALSIGCAIYPDDGNDAETLLAEADRRMYGEKQQHHIKSNTYMVAAGPATLHNESPVL